MDDAEKLKVLLPHWIEHNVEHATEFREWAARAGAVEGDLLKAAGKLLDANAALSDALERLEHGGQAL